VIEVHTQLSLLLNLQTHKHNKKKNRKKNTHTHTVNPHKHKMFFFQFTSAHTHTNLIEELVEVNEQAEERIVLLSAPESCRQEVQSVHHLIQHEKRQVGRRRWGKGVMTELKFFSFFLFFHDEKQVVGYNRSLKYVNVR
jgi:hypothetical protein